jgi:hypothetical protein
MIVRESPGPPMISFISPIRIDEQQPPPPCVVSQLYAFSTWCTTSVRGPALPSRMAGLAVGESVIGC